MQPNSNTRNNKHNAPTYLKPIRNATATNIPKHNPKYTNHTHNKNANNVHIIIILKHNVRIRIGEVDKSDDKLCIYDRTSCL